MRKTVSSVLLGMSLMSACSKSRDVNAIPTSIDHSVEQDRRPRATLASEPRPATEAVITRATTSPTPPAATQARPDPGAAAGSGVGYASVDQPSKIAERRAATEASSGED